VTAFQAPKTSIGSLDAEAAATLISAAADMALVVDEAGIIRDVAFSSGDLAREFEELKTWLGRAWVDVVLRDSRSKVEELLRDAAAGPPARWRHINMESPRGGAPILFAAVKVGTQGRVVAVGRDLRPMSVLQQRLVEAQQSLERDFSRLRHAETRYRLLFQMSAEPVLIVEAATLKVADANDAAQRLFAVTPRRANRNLPELFESASEAALQSLLATVRAGNRADDVRARLATDGRDVVVSASLFRQDAAALFLVRLSFPEAATDTVVLPKPKSKLLKLVENAPDAFVVADQQNRIITANAAFIEMAQLAAEDQAQGEPLDRWLGRPGIDLDVLNASLRSRGSVRLYTTEFRGEHGTTIEVELSAVTITNGGAPCHGFAIRDVGLRLAAERGANPAGGRSVEQLTGLIGRVPLKDLVREATDQIERLCIEAALQLAGDNRASAAEMLGLSRQSLYVKLRRYGLGDLGTDGAEGL